MKCEDFDNRCHYHFNLTKCSCDTDILSFKKFLEDNNALANYENELTYSCMEQMVEPKNWINFAFYWPDSIDGYDYWKELNDKWLNELRIDYKEVRFDI